MNRTLPKLLNCALYAGMILSISLTGALAQTSAQGSSVIQNGPAKATEVVGENIRESDIPLADGPSPLAIGFITSSNPYCHQPDRTQNVCYINWRYISVTASPDNMRYLRIKIDGQVVAYYGGFFDTAITAYPDHHG